MDADNITGRVDCRPAYPTLGLLEHPEQTSFKTSEPRAAKKRIRLRHQRIDVHRKEPKEREALYESR